MLSCLGDLLEATDMYEPFVPGVLPNKYIRADHGTRESSRVYISRSERPFVKWADQARNTVSCK